ncbi:CpsD/CapB family tyrosine-protein kinase [Sneathiella glossodoripedis]|uniref:CpsD/CapB family tyrosine-protein kinase n=1 Tax=Sneathiella glossodoripedis TaxID=418853 RepID=UPI00046E7ED5|nr:CpsD/CapB family tyrosine-protein kinase [Sneathiella glossodoripedis]
MERIKDAISKARQSQTQSGLNKSLSPSRPRRPAPDVESEKIAYSETTVTELDTKQLSSNRIITFDSEDPDSVAFDVLRTQVLAKMDENGWNTLAITSPSPECGKTVVALNLALSIAKQTDKTALAVDFDLKRPRIADYLGLKPKASLFDYLEHDLEVKDILINPGFPRLVVLPNTVPVKNSAETLTSRRVKSLVHDLKSRYESRIVIYDLPPLMAGDDAIAFMPQVDCVLLVVASGETKPIEVKEARRQIQSTNLLGVVLNKSSERQTHYY